MRITLSATLAVSVGGKRLRDAEILKQLDGLFDPDETIPEYEQFNGFELGAGYLHCVFDPDQNEARIVTEFDAPRQLGKKELQAVTEATRGQWLDGIGESLFDDFCDAFDCSVDISSKVKIVQVEGRAWKPAGKSKVKKFKKPKSKPATNADKTAALSKKLFKSEKAAEVKALLQAGADANARDNDGFQPLHLPNFLRQSSIVKLLLDHGADVNGKTANEKETPLMIAACYGLLPTVELLLSAGAAVELKDQSGHTALVHAVCGLLIQNIKPNEKIVQSLLKAGARITPEVMIQAGMDSTPKIVQLLLDRGGDVNAAKAGKWTALSSAIYMRNVGIVKSLLKAGADPNCMVYQQTALAAAQQSGNAAIARALREAHAK